MIKVIYINYGSKEKEGNAWIDYFKYFQCFNTWAKLRLSFLNYIQHFLRSLNCANGLV
ncbi:hypothetical protein SAMN05216524_107176 [Mucilaginibacter sp. OK098]|nr:hypothetical protein SAMN05216524_107176 [Mucilaginibacter sp. OK098]